MARCEPRSSYDEYVDTGLDWLPEAPSHWQRVRLGRVCDMISGSTPSKGERRYWEGSIPWVSPKDMKVDEIHDSSDHISEEALRETGIKLVEPPAVLIVVRGMILAHSFPVARIVCPVTINQDMKALKFRQGIDDRFAVYLLNGIRDIVLAEVEEAAHGTRRLTTGRWKQIETYLPPPAEQSAIAAFLDRETAKIDALIDTKQWLINLLEEKRTALIMKSVTKGLNPDVKTRTSGVHWIGEIPVHWGVVRIRRVARLETGHTPSRQNDEYWENCTIPWFGLADVWQIRDGRREFVTDTEERVSELGLRHSSARLLPEGTVILSRTASVGFSGIMGTDMATTQDFANWVCGPDIIPLYLLYVFRAMRPEFRRLTMGSTHQTIYMPEVHRFVTPLPPVEEQREIVAHLRDRLEKLHANAATTQGAIDLLREYRTALVSATVTGTINVKEISS